MAERIVSSTLYDQESSLPPLEDLVNLPERAISPSLPGNLYEIHQLIDEKGRMYAKKTLRATAIAGRYPEGYTIAAVFQ